MTRNTPTVFFSLLALGLLVASAFTRVDEAPPVPLAPPKAHMVVRHATSLCDVSGGLPAVYCVDRPVIGEPHRVQWNTRPTVPPDPPTRLCVLLVSPHKAEARAIPGANGCMLMVHPTWRFVPTANTLVTQDGGRVFLDWTPPATLSGVTLYMQLLVADFGADLDQNGEVDWRQITVSPMLELTPGVR